MRVLPHLPGSMPGSEHRSLTARRHIGRQRRYNLPELLEIAPLPGHSGLGPTEIRRGFFTSRDPTLGALSR
jgi:hypothetical protein